jgi:signal transduction histidine kinase
LAALTSCLKNLPKIPEEDRILMRNAANRINDIANNMLLRYESKNMDASEIQKNKIWLLSPLVESMVSEKRSQFMGSQIELDSEISSDGFSAFAEFDASELKRVLSNLINNAFEAFPEKSGKITVFLAADSHTLF